MEKIIVLEDVLIRPADSNARSNDQTNVMPDQTSIDPPNKRRRTEFSASEMLKFKADMTQFILNSVELAK